MGEDLTKIFAFLSEINLPVFVRDLPMETFLPGVAVIDGRLCVDLERLKYPGDILHEAGHLALLTETARNESDGDFKDAEGYEVGALAWSYAASVCIGLPLEVLFHNGGYKGDSEWLVETFANGCYIGLPILEWKGLASSSGHHAYPSMHSWLCK